MVVAQAPTHGSTAIAAAAISPPTFASTTVASHTAAVTSTRTKTGHLLTRALQPVQLPAAAESTQALHRLLLGRAGAK